MSEKNNLNFFEKLFVLIVGILSFYLIFIFPQTYLGFPKSTFLNCMFWIFTVILVIAFISSLFKKKSSKKVFNFNEIKSELSENMFVKNYWLFLFTSIFAVIFLIFFNYLKLGLEYYVKDPNSFFVNYVFYFIVLLILVNSLSLLSFISSLFMFHSEHINDKRKLLTFSLVNSSSFFVIIYILNLFNITFLKGTYYYVFVITNALIVFFSFYLLFRLDIKKKKIFFDFHFILTYIALLLLFLIPSVIQIHKLDNQKLFDSKYLDCNYSVNSYKYLSQGTIILCKVSSNISNNLSHSYYFMRINSYKRTNFKNLSNITANSRIFINVPNLSDRYSFNFLENGTEVYSEWVEVVSHEKYLTTLESIENKKITYFIGSFIVFFAFLQFLISYDNWKRGREKYENNEEQPRKTE